MVRLSFNVKPSIHTEPVNVDVHSKTPEQMKCNYVVCQDSNVYQLVDEEFENLERLISVSSGYATMYDVRITFLSPKGSNGATPVR